MFFSINQRVVCVDDSNILGPAWGTLIKGNVYVIDAFQMYCGTKYVSVDGIGRRDRFWHPSRFRPLVDDEVEDFFMKGADPESEKWDNRVKKPVNAWWAPAGLTRGKIKIELVGKQIRLLDWR